jgi:hypothetical protein
MLRSVYPARGIKIQLVAPERVWDPRSSLPLHQTSYLPQPTSTVQGHTSRRLLLNAVIVALLVLAALEVGARVVERLPLVRQRLALTPRGELLSTQSTQLRELLNPTPGRVLQLDSLLGWIYGEGNHGDTIIVNAQKHRGRDTVSSRSDGVLRIAAWGDSFVFCNDVRDEHCWLARVSESLPFAEVLNFGVGGYGLDQAVLRFERDVSWVRPDVALLGFTEVDLSRLLNVYRRFLHDQEPALFKPRFLSITADSFVLLPAATARPNFVDSLLENPMRVRELGVHDAYYPRLRYESPLQDVSALWRVSAAVWQRIWVSYLSPDRPSDLRGRFRVESEAFRVQVYVFERFVREARRLGITPYIVLLPGENRVSDRLHGRPESVAPLRDTLEKLQLPVLDLAAPLAAAAARVGTDELFELGVHYSPIGNDVVGRWMADTLRRSNAKVQ